MNLVHLEGIRDHRRQAHCRSEQGEGKLKAIKIKIVSNTGVVKIAMDYTVPVDLLFYHFDLHFTPSSENKALF